MQLLGAGGDPLPPLRTPLDIVLCVLTLLIGRHEGSVKYRNFAPLFI